MSCIDTLVTAHALLIDPLRISIHPKKTKINFKFQPIPTTQQIPLTHTYISI